MKMELMHIVHRLFEAGQKMLCEAEYNLIVVEEEAVPLAAGDMVTENHLLPFTLIVMGMVFAMTVFVLYWSRCRQYRLRIQALCREKEPVRMGWNLKQLKETVSEMEWKMAGK